MEHKTLPSKKAEPLEAGFPISELNISAGLDAKSGLPVILIEGLPKWGVDIPDQKHLLDPKAAVKMGAALIAAGNPEAIVRLLTAFGGGKPGLTALESRTVDDIVAHLKARPEMLEEVRRRTETLTRSQTAVIEALDCPATTRQIAKTLGRSQSGVWNTLRDLEARGFVKIVGNVSSRRGPDADQWARA